MTKKFISTLILLVIINYNAIADIPEILIKPNNEEYTRLSAGLAGSNITIISSETILILKSGSKKSSKSILPSTKMRFFSSLFLNNKDLIKLDIF